MNKPRINFTYPVFPDLTVPTGYLPNDKRAQACWYYYTLAEQSRQTVGNSTEDQIILEGELWMDKHYVQQAKTIAAMYQLDSPDEMFKFWKYVITQAIELGYPIPAEEYMKPLGRILM